MSDAPPTPEPDAERTGPALAHPVDGHVEHVPQGAYETGYLLLATLFVAMLMLTNVIGTKLFLLPLDLPLFGPLLAAFDRFVSWLFPGAGNPDGLTLTTGIITYPITFLCTDIVSEVYGRKRADRMVLWGFAASLLMLVVIGIAKSLPASPFWNVPAPHHAVFGAGHLIETAKGPAADATAAWHAYAFTFDAPGVLLFASMTAYLVAQLVDNRLFHFWRRLTRGKHLWFRNNMSTGLSQLVDTIIVNGIFLHFYFEMPAASIGAVIVAVYLVKFLLALLDTPLCYLGVWWVGKVVRPRG